MQAQNRAAQQTQTILVVDSDEATRRILDLTLRHAGFTVGSAAGGEEATKRLAERPDLVIAAADDADGLAFCRLAKETADGMPPAVVLISASDLESKRKGLEAGADDFVVRPIYVQEVVARARALLQRRERERLELSAQHGHRFASAIDDVPLVDLVRAIAGNQKSGVAVVESGGDGAGRTRGEIFFRQGRIVDAEVGRLSGRDALYRMFCWSSGRLEVDWKSIRRKDTIELAPHDLLMEALRRVDDWRRLLADLPALDTIFEVNYRLLAERLADIPDEVNRILRLFDGMRTFMQVIDDCGLSDLDGVAAVGKLCRERIIHDVRVPVEEDEVIGADMEGWLSDAAGPFRSPPRLERDLFGTAPEAGVGVHGRSTAPLDPLGDGARDALDDDMRSRFTDRLAAEGGIAEGVLAAGPSPGSSAATEALALPTLPPLPAAALVDAGGNGARPPITLPGVGAARTTDSGRPAVEMSAHADAQAPVAPSAFGPSTARGMAASGAGALGTERRSASGEIVVKKPPPKSVHAAVGELRVAQLPAKAEPLRAPTRGSYVTPPGSARALDEPPPLLMAEPLPAAARSRAAPAAAAGEEGEGFSASDAADELGLPSRRMGVMLVLGAVMVIGAAVAILVLRPSKSRRSVAGRDPGSQLKTAARTGPKPPVVVPMPSKESPPAPIGSASGQPGATAAARRTPAGATAPVASSPVHDGQEERIADPKLARTRAAEAGALLSGCNRAFAERRFKDAEAACIAARDANPDSAEAHGLLAHAMFNRNRRREALSAAERAVKLNPKLADPYVIIGGVHQDHGETEQARRAYQRYLDLDPKGQYAGDLRAILTKLPAKL